MYCRCQDVVDLTAVSGWKFQDHLLIRVFVRKVYRHAFTAGEISRAVRRARFDRLIVPTHLSRSRASAGQCQKELT
jgi:hypothetical protein